MGSSTNALNANTIDLGTVGYYDDATELPETTPAYVRWEEGEPIVEVTTREGDRITARIGVPDLQIRFGQQVVLAMLDGDPANAVIVGALQDSVFSAPASVAGVQTGAASATTKGVRVPAATWRFVRLDDGEHYAIQTQAGGDMLFHAGASIHIRCNPTTGAVHIEGATHLGVAPTVPPTGSTTGPGGADIPGVPATPYVPTPYATPGAQSPAPTPYVGYSDGLVRAKDIYQSDQSIDPTFWTWIIAVDALARAANPATPPMPVNLYSAISGAAGPGSKHTAVGEPEPT